MTAVARPLSAHVLSRLVRGISAVSRVSGRGGSVIGGRVALQLDHSALRRLASDRSVLFVTGTNGKTTTTAFLAAAIRTVSPIVTNMTGANLKTGIVSAFAQDLKAPMAVLEIDEAALGPVLEETGAAVVVLLNLSRDQLDRYGEVRMTAAKWRRALERAADAHVVAYADDPLVAWAAATASAVTWVSGGQRWRMDAASCPECGGRISWEGDAWSCRCGFARPEPDIVAEPGRITLAGGEVLPLRLALPGRCNAANAAMALAAARVVGVPPAAAAQAMESITDVAGRYREVSVGSSCTRLLLAKNPAGWNEILDFLLPPPASVVIAVNARGPDGYDPSWLWDVEFERLGTRPVMAAGERALDVAVRLRYAGVPHEICTDPIAAVHQLPRGRVELVANYTAFQSVLGTVRQ
jgi:lipid II isoglutaminyl synthase (glutamine-hydrolysing)